MDFNFTGEVPSDTLQGTYNQQVIATTNNYSATSFKNVKLTYNEYSTNVGWDNTNDKFVGQSDNSGYRIDYYLRFDCLILLVESPASVVASLTAFLRSSKVIGVP